MEVKVLKTGLFALDVRTIKYLTSGQVLDLPDDQVALLIETGWGSSVSFKKENTSYAVDKNLVDGFVLNDDAVGLRHYAADCGIELKSTTIKKMARELLDAVNSNEPAR